MDLVKPSSSETKILVAFIAAQPDGQSQSATSASSKQRVADWLHATEFRDMIAKRLLWALVPRICVPIESMPVNNSGKVDRRKLSMFLEDMTVYEVLRLDHASAPAAVMKRTPKILNESKLRKI
ncbi:hypothetical protein LZ30DRAFT_784592 [Colletotrichum cereale]|nr:hypothetical protein LZ30DRAFT_784592 [Colletotrichum cereale]